MTNKLKKLSDEFSSKYRKKLLQLILSQIKSGEFDNVSIDPNKLYMLHSPVRKEYQAPRDISGYNWGEMSVWEMDAGMNEAY